MNLLKIVSVSVVLNILLIVALIALGHLVSYLLGWL